MTKASPHSQPTQRIPFNNQVYHQMIQDRTPVVISSSDLEFSFSTYVIAYKPKSQTLILKNTVPLDHIHHLAHKHSFTISIPLFHIHTTTFSGDGFHFVFPINRIERIDSSREFHRFKPPQSQAWLHYHNPYDGTTKYTKKVLTISQGGLSFETTFNSRLLHPGQRFTQASIMLNNQLISTTDFTTIYLKQHFNIDTQEKFQVGVKFQTPIPQITQHFM